MTVYIIMAAVTAAAGFFLFAFLLKRKGQRPSLALKAFPLCVVLGFLCAKIMYEVLMRAEYFLVWGEWDVFLDLRPRRMSFVCGACGVVLGTAAAARLSRMNVRDVLDCFAVPGALLIAGFRFAERELGKLGAGSLTEGAGIFSRPPFAVLDDYGDYYTAIFFWEAVIALFIMAYALKMNEKRRGIRFSKTVFALCLCQILLENMRSQSMRWGFVCVEQVLCAVIMFILVLLPCLRNKNKNGRLLPAAGFLMGAGDVVGAELARQKTGVLFLAKYGYGLMILALAGMAVMYRAALKGYSSSGQESSKGA